MKRENDKQKPMHGFIGMGQMGSHIWVGEHLCRIVFLYTP